jgi:SAM-dependent methyltransferase
MQGNRAIASRPTDSFGPGIRGPKAEQDLVFSATAACSLTRSGVPWAIQCRNCNDKVMTLNHSNITTVPSLAVDYYQSISYWNHFELVYRRLNRRATGDENTFWYQELLAAGHRFERALILNCGNGWVERDLVRIGLVRKVVGIDISDDLLAQARSAASEAGIEAEYFRIDVNVDPMPAGEFDLIVNHAAAHHISAIDRVTRQLADRLSNDGLFVNWDYIGPHRNQYTARQWEAAQLVNAELPVELRQEMRYPDIDTMLAVDPTEAVHSELIVSTQERYFDIVNFRPLGGAIGYLLLTHNLPFYEQPLNVVEDWVRFVMDADERFLESNPDQSLFAYFIARKKNVAPSADDLRRWTADEESRERTAVSNGGEYYPRTTLATALQEQNPTSPHRWRHSLGVRFPTLVGIFRSVRSRIIKT